MNLKYLCYVILIIAIVVLSACAAVNTGSGLMDEKGTVTDSKCGRHPGSIFELIIMIHGCSRKNS